ncbi:MAG: hypothetical protein ACK5LY_07605 [Lachnospirales bacterium]
MRKIIFLVVLLVGLTSCGENEEIKNVETTDSKSIAVASEEVNENKNDVKATEKEETETRENTTFRNTVWGDSIEDVKKYETAELLEENTDALVFEDIILGRDMYVIYYFNNDKLTNSVYGLKNELSNGGQYLQQYNNFKESLIEIYGEPKEDGTQKFKDDDSIAYAGESDALEFGYLAYFSRWENESTLIQMGLFYENFDPQFVISYSDKNYKEDVSKSGL